MMADDKSELSAAVCLITDCSENLPLSQAGRLRPASKFADDTSVDQIFTIGDCEGDDE